MRKFKSTTAKNVKAPKSRQVEKNNDKNDPFANLILQDQSSNLLVNLQDEIKVVNYFEEEFESNNSVSQQAPIILYTNPLSKAEEDIQVVSQQQSKANKAHKIKNNNRQKNRKQKNESSQMDDNIKSENSEIKQGSSNKQSSSDSGSSSDSSSSRKSDQGDEIDRGINNDNSDRNVKVFNVGIQEKKEKVGLFKTLRISMNVKKFVTNLRKFQTRRYLPYTKQHFSLINDNANGDHRNLKFRGNINLQLLQKADKQKTMIKDINKMLRKCWRYILALAPVRAIDFSLGYLNTKVPVIDPDANWKLIWDYLLAIVILGMIIIIPVDTLVKQGIISEDSNRLLFGGILTLIGINILFSLNTGFFEKGELVSYRQSIWRYQKSKHLYANLLSWGILLVINFFNLSFIQFFYLQQPQYSASYFYYLRFLLFSFYYYIFYLIEFLNKFECIVQLNKYQLSLYQITKLILILLFLNHLFSCVWIRIGQWSIENNLINWITEAGLESVTPLFQYINALYFTTVTLTSVGYGDISPQNIYEKLFSIVNLMVATVGLSYGIGTVGTIIQQLTSATDQQQQKFRVINAFMRHHKFNRKFQNEYFSDKQFLLNRIREYLKYIWKVKGNVMNHQEEEIITDLSENLRNQLKNRINHSILESSKFLTENFSKEFIKDLSHYLDTKTVMHEDCIGFQNLDDPCIVYVSRGQIDNVILKEDNSTVIIKTSTQGQFIGVQEFVLQQKSALLYKSNGISQIYSLPRSIFVKQIKTFPKDKEAFHQIENQAKIYSNYSELYEQCGSCYKFQHSISQCRYIHFQVDREKVIKSYQFPMKNQRRNFRRKPRSVVNARGDNQTVCQQANNFCNEHQDYCRLYQESENFDQQILPILPHKHTQQLIELLKPEQQNQSQVQSKMLLTMPNQNILQSSMKIQNLQENIVNFDQDDNYSIDEMIDPRFQNFITPQIIQEQDHNFQFEKTRIERQPLERRANHKEYLIVHYIYQYQHQSLSQKISYLALHNTLFGDKAIHQAQLVYLRLQNSEQNTIEIDLMNNYQYFEPSYNLEVCIRNANKSSFFQVMNYGASQKKLREKRRMGAYLIHPSEFLSQYRNQPSGSDSKSIFIPNDPQQQNMQIKIQSKDRRSRKFIVN